MKATPIMTIYVHRETFRGTNLFDKWQAKTPRAADTHQNQEYSKTGRRSKMINNVSVPLTCGSASSFTHRKRILTSVLWIIQGLLALLFLFAGSIKLIMPIEMLTAQMPLPLPGHFLQFIGTAEVA